MVRSTSASRWPSRATKTTRVPAPRVMSATTLPTIPSGTELIITEPRRPSAPPRSPCWTGWARIAGLAMVVSAAVEGNDAGKHRARHRFGNAFHAGHPGKDVMVGDFEQAFELGKLGFGERS